MPPSMICSADDRGDHLLVLLVAVGLVLSAVSLVAASLCCCLRRARKNEEHEEVSPEDEAAEDATPDLQQSRDKEASDRSDCFQSQ